MDRRILACVASMAAGVNFLPWTGPTVRAAAALHVSTTDLFRPLIPVQVVGLAFVFGVAVVLGRREARRLGLERVDGPPAPVGVPNGDRSRLRRPGRFWLNAVLTIAILAVMISGAVDSARPSRSSSTTRPPTCNARVWTPTPKRR
jgi:CitMHS family citrate-Mg2+:H+ or citrate-Ca2+:H+ symporter